MEGHPLCLLLETGRMTGAVSLGKGLCGFELLHDGFTGLPLPEPVLLPLGCNIKGRRTTAQLSAASPVQFKKTQKTQKG